MPSNNNYLTGASLWRRERPVHDSFTRATSSGEPAAIMQLPAFLLHVTKSVHYADHDGQLPHDKQNWWDWRI